MQRMTLCLAAFLALAAHSLAQSATTLPSYPSPVTITLQSNPNLGLGVKESLVYLLPTNAGGTARFNVVAGLANPKDVSFESVDFPGYFLRHQCCQIKLHPYAEHDDLYASDATFVPVANPKGGWMFRAYAPYWLWLSMTRDNALFAAPNPRYEDSTFILTP